MGRRRCKVNLKLKGFFSFSFFLITTKLSTTMYIQGNDWHYFKSERFNWCSHNCWKHSLKSFNQLLQNAQLLKKLLDIIKLLKMCLYIYFIVMTAQITEAQELFKFLLFISYYILLKSKDGSNQNYSKLFPWNMYKRIIIVK